MGFYTLASSKEHGRGSYIGAGTEPRQSPIDIIPTKPLPKDLRPLKLVNWNKKLSGSYQNTGLLVLFTASNAEGVEVIKGGQKYKVCSFNIHWGANSNEGSEHLINGRAYPGEVHIITVKDTLNCQDITSYTERDDVLVILVFLKAVNIHIAIYGKSCHLFRKDTFKPRKCPTFCSLNFYQLMTRITTTRGP